MMNLQSGDRVHINGIVTFVRPGVWRRGGVLEANNVTLMRERHNGMWEVQIPDLGLCLIHRTAITVVERQMTIRVGGKALREAMEEFQRKNPGPHVNIVST